MNIWLLIVLMTLATFVPRALPLILLKEVRLPPFWDRFFACVPYAALGVLIFPGILSSAGNFSSSLAGTVAAILMGWLRWNPTVVVFGAVAASALASILF